MNKKVIVLGTSRKTRGGITSVIKAHELGEQWKEHNCIWIETQIDSNIFLKFKYLLKSLFYFSFLIQKYDIVHIHTVGGNCARIKSIFVFISKAFKKKTIIHLHIGNQIDNYKNKFFFNYVLKNADLIIVLSNQIKRKLVDNFHLKNRIEVLYNPCEVVNKKEYYDIDSTTIITVGILNANKGYKDIIKAFSLISNKYPQWNIVFAGNGELNEARELAKKLNIEDKIILKGWITGFEKEQLFNKAAALCLASYAEGFPMAVLDAWSYGVPVICTPVGGLPDVVKDGINGLMFNCGNIDELAQKLELLIRDFSLRKRLSNQVIHLANTTFKLENINKRLAEIYGSI